MVVVVWWWCGGRAVGGGYGGGLSGTEFGGGGEAAPTRAPTHRRSPPAQSDQPTKPREPHTQPHTHHPPTHTHAQDCICSGYIFGTKPGGRVVYLSDLSRLPESTRARLQVEAAQGIDLLVIDCLGKRVHNTHLGIEQSLAIVAELRPKRTYMLGMSCDTFPDHDEMNKVRGRVSEGGASAGAWRGTARSGWCRGWLCPLALNLPPPNRACPHSNSSRYRRRCMAGSSWRTMAWC